MGRLGQICDNRCGAMGPNPPAHLSIQLFPVVIQAPLN